MPKTIGFRVGDKFYEEIIEYLDKNAKGDTLSDKLRYHWIKVLETAE